MAKSKKQFLNENLVRIELNDPSLTTLDTKNVKPIGVAKLCDMLKVFNNTALTTLVHRTPTLHEDDLFALAANTSLRNLVICSYAINDTVAEILSTNTTIQSLRLVGGRIGEAGASALAQNKTLTSLNLHINFYT